jgi:hypothetical protein
MKSKSNWVTGPSQDFGNRAMTTGVNCLKTPGKLGAVLVELVVAALDQASAGEIAMKIP